MDDWLEAHRTPLAAAILIVAAAGALLWLQRSGDDRPLVVVAITPTPAATPSGDLAVYVSGAVARPGVYALREGDRVEQAVFAAGGLAADAEPAAVNLAARLRDEQQVHVPRRGEGRSPEGAPSAPAAPGTPRATGARLVDLNSATTAELEALPGIGAVTAQRIADHRARNGPFRDVEELRSARLVNAATYEKVQPLVTVREPAPR